MGSKRNRNRPAKGPIRPSSYQGRDGVTYTAAQVAEMLAADRAARRPGTPVAKSTIGVPAAIQQAEAAQQMTPTSAFSPGTPIAPYDGYSRHPRATPYTTGYNIATRPRLHERVSFDTLKGLVSSYDVAQIVIWHRIDSIRSLDWKLIAADGYKGDVTDAIAIGMKALKKPDRHHHFDTWLAKWLWDVLAYDAGALYRLRNKAGRAIGLLPIDGTTIAPLLDYWGQTPQPPAEAYAQYVAGLPWNWLTSDDLIYEPFRPHNDSIYGFPPIESIILNANTDLRFQLYFIQRFTEGNLPEVFAAAPESWTPDQIELWQQYWDGFMYGDQSRKHQVRWMPGGSSFAWTNEKDFSDTFSLFMMRKTAAAYHVVPSDIGFTENVNRSSGESQADVQHRIGDLPLISYVEGILSGFLQDDLGLPLKHEFDRGEEQADRIQLAQADKIYMESGVISGSDIRSMRYGLEEPEGRPMPRYIMSSRGGPIPLASLYAVAGTIDQETAAPEPGAPLPEEVFGGVEGVIPNPPLKVMSLAERMYGEQAMPPEPPPQPKLVPDPSGGLMTVQKEGEGAATAGITAATGIYGYDGPGHREHDDQADEDDEEGGKPPVQPGTAIVKRHLTIGEARAAGRQARDQELAAFSRFCRARRKDRRWRDFTFDHHSPSEALALNRAGKVAVAKADGQIAVAGLAVLALDTGRVLMLQRALCDDDPAAGTWEFPGGHLEDGETPVVAAAREWCEETGCILPLVPETMAAIAFGNGGTWTSNGIYQGFVYPVPSEASVKVRSAVQVVNPDVPDGDQVEAIAWWNPEQLAGNPAVRPELAAALGDVLPLLGVSTAGQPAGGDEAVCPCGVPVVYDDLDGWQHADGSVSHDDGQSVSDKMSAIDVAKAYPDGQTYSSHAFRPTAGYPVICHYCGVGASDPMHDAYRTVAKAEGGGAGPKDWPGWKLDLQAAAHWAPKLTAAARRALTRARLQEIADSYIAAHPDQDGKATGKHDRNAAAFTWLTDRGVTVPAADVASGLTADAVLIGGASAQAAVNGQDDADTGGWSPGDTAAATAAVGALGLAALLASAGGGGAGDLPDIAGDMEGGYLAVVARILAGWDPDVASAELTDMLETAVADGAYAEALTVTQITAISGQAALSVYALQQGLLLAWVAVLDSRTCRICVANAAADPRPAGIPWPSGDLCPGIHPLDRCALVPAGGYVAGPEG